MSIPGKDSRLVPYGSTNLGMPLGLVEGLVVPNDRFFVRSNGAHPKIDRGDWMLTIDGAVESTLEIDFDALLALPRQTLTAFLECTGNGRSRFTPETDGTPWKNDAAGNAVWTGASLRDVLNLVRPLETAVDLVTQGADLPSMRRGLPVALAHDRNILLVYEMNGEPLPPAHGGPVRLLVPGWAGIASTKWLSRLEFWDHPFTGEYQGDLYVLYDEDGVPVGPITQMPVKSLIAHPAEDARLADGQIIVSGYAWSGHAGIAVVEVQIDNDELWRTATITDSDGPFSWYRWEIPVDLPPGPHSISSRATDLRGHRQPRIARWNQKGYQMNAIHSIDITVTPKGR